MIAIITLLNRAHVMTNIDYSNVSRTTVFQFMEGKSTRDTVEKVAFSGNSMQSNYT